MASLWLNGTAEQTEASWQSVDRLARALGVEDPRTLDQKRLDLAHGLLQGILSVTDLGSVQAAVGSVSAAAGTGAGVAGGSEGASPAAGGAVPDPGAATAAGGATAVSGAAVGETGAEATVATAADGPVTGPNEATAVPSEVLVEAVARALQNKPDPNEVIGRKPLIHVVVALDTLMGGDRPAELVGHGPIPAPTARALAAGGVWKRLVVDPLSGALLDHGRTTYSPPDALDDFVRARKTAGRVTGTV